MPHILIALLFCASSQDCVPMDETETDFDCGYVWEELTHPPDKKEDDYYVYDYSDDYYEEAD